MSKPDWRLLELEAGVLREPSPDANRIVLWVPGERTGRYRHWERVGNVPGATVEVDRGLCATAASSVPARQHVRGFLESLLRRFRRPAVEATWLLPDGGFAEQAGERQADLLLIWAEEGAAPLEEEGLKGRWPQATRFRRLGPNLFLIGGVASAPAAPSGPPPGGPLEQAEQLLAEARKTGDRRAEAGALTDLGILKLRSGDAPRAVVVLEEALGIARQAGDRSRETDILSQLALALVAVRQPERGAGLLGEALASARAAGDPFAEKTALDHLGIVRTALRDYRAAGAAYEQALALARTLGDRQHEADLLWSLAIEHAALEERDRAVARAQEAVDLFRLLGSPHVAWLNDHLQRYRAGQAGARLVPAAEAASRPREPVTGQGWTAVVTAGQPGRPPEPPQTVSGPGLLHMAISAVKSMTWFLASGAKTVSQATQRKRIDVCATCPHHTGLRCRVCGCFTSIKTWLPHERCPLAKWPE